ERGAQPGEQNADEQPDEQAGDQIEHGPWLHGGRGSRRRGGQLKRVARGDLVRGDRGQLPDELIPRTGERAELVPVAGLSHLGDLPAEPRDLLLDLLLEDVRRLDRPTAYARDKGVRHVARKPAGGGWGRPLGVELDERRALHRMRRETAGELGPRELPAV